MVLLKKNKPNWLDLCTEFFLSDLKDNDKLFYNPSLKHWCFFYFIYLLKKI